MKPIFKSIGYMLLYMIFQMLVMSLAAMAIGMGAGGSDLVAASMQDHFLGLNLLTNALAMLLVILIYKKRGKQAIRELHIKLVGVGKYMVPCILAFACSMAFSLFTRDILFENASQIQVSVKYYSDQSPLLAGTVHIMALLVFAPLIEEIICRGVILTTLQQKFNSTLSIFLSAFIFGIFHIMAGGMLLAAGAVIMGMVFGIIYVKTKSLLPAIVAHMVANVPDFILTALPRFPKGVENAMAAVCGALFFVVLYAFLKSEHVAESAGQ